MIENNNKHIYYIQDSGTIHKHFNKLTIDKFFIVNVKFVNNEGMIITMVTVVAMVTITIDILVVDMFQEDNTCMASLLQELLSQEKPSLPGELVIVLLNIGGLNIAV